MISKSVRKKIILYVRIQFEGIPTYINGNLLKNSKALIKLKSY